MRLKLPPATRRLASLSCSSALGLLAWACTPSDVQPNAVDDAGAPNAAAGLGPDWGEVTNAREQADAHAFGAVADGFLAVQPLMGMDVRLSQEGTSLGSGPDALRLVTIGWGRDDRLAPLGGEVQLGECVSTGEELPGGACVQRVERGEGAVEWWASTPGRVQVGWDLARPPRGTGPIVVEMHVENAEILDLGDDHAVAFIGADREWGFADLAAWDDNGKILDAWMEVDGSTLRIVVDDEGATWPIHIDPVSYSAGWTQSGSSAEYLGRSVAGIGDVNFDGYDDVAVGAPAYSTSTGRVYIYHGTSSGLSTTAATRLTGPTTSTYFGRSVDGAGDVNGDGFDDLIVGADGVSSSAGAAYLYYGSSTGVSSSADITLSGNAASSFGYAVAGAGDVDRDGYADVIVGAYANGSPNYIGAAYVFEGSPTGLSTTAAATLTGAASLSSFGIDVDGAGDVNGDGYDDVIVGASQYNSNTGYAEVFHGSSSGVASTASRTLSGDATLNNFGGSVAGAGDVDADGYDDVVIGAWGYSSYYGRAQVFHGSASGVGASATTSITGPAIAYFGYAVAGAGDIDADGYDDIVVGGYLYSSSAGLVRTYAGSSGGISSSYHGTVTGSSTSCLGFSVASAGDVNGDTRSDIIVGGYCASSSNGYAAVYYGLTDADGDGYYVGAGVSTSSDDCDDTNSAVSPGATEVPADGIDNNCDNYETCYDDDDNDGYLDTTADTRNSSDLDCTDTYEGTSADPTTDCDDNSSADYPGATETTANGDDEDCDGAETCYDDDDNDGYLDTTGDTRASTDTDCSDSYEGTTSDATTDCDDADSTVRPNATEVVDDGIDQNCDNYESCYDDDDDDGYLDTTADRRNSSDLDCTDAYEGGSSTATTDCDDSSAADYPGATETTANGDDEDCDGYENCYDDDDNDGYLDTTGDTRASTDTDCNDAYEGTSTDPTTDCDDASSGDRPGATETVANGDDEDCDGAETCYDDDDNDGYLDTTADTRASTDTDCDDAYEGLSTDPTTDCDDTSALDYPGATETVANGDDEDCDGYELCYDDDDDDGYLDAAGDTRSSTDSDCLDDNEGGSSTPTTDCDDTDADANPGETEAVADGLDADCDGYELCYDDDDGDGYLDTRGDTRSSADTDCQDANEGDASTDTTDCDDADATSYPSAVEVAGDTIDQDCDGSYLCFEDDDNDGYLDGSGDTRVSTDDDCNDAYEGSTSSPSTDCDDSDDDVHPGATDAEADGVDGDCDGEETCYTDADDDGYAVSTLRTSSDGDCADSFEASATDLARGTDCDDSDSGTHPGATEVVGDEVDGDCDGEEICYDDADEDGYSGGTQQDSADSDCSDAGEVTATSYAATPDCDDTDDTRSPAAAEVCDARDTDEDCDGLADDDDPGVSSGTRTTWYADADGDGYGDAGAPQTLCDQPAGHVDNDDDCDDTDNGVYPGAAEVNGDEVDQDCDGGESCLSDLDADGYASSASVASSDTDCTDAGEATLATLALGEDCDDSSATTSPAGAEVCDPASADEDCDGLIGEADPSVDSTTLVTWYPDADGDNYGLATDGVVACDRPEGYGGYLEDCDDNNAEVNPGLDEVVGDEADSNCDALEACYVDADGDGWATAESAPSDDLDCDDAGEADAVVASIGVDCDDAEPAVNPGMEEVCDALDTDEDCDGLADDADDSATGKYESWFDADGDDYGEGDAVELCDPEDIYALAGGDCDDIDPEINPSAVETCDEVDEDCDGDVDEEALDATTWYPDADGDGYGGSLGVAACAQPEGYLAEAGDCDEDAALVNPAAEETCNDIDDDCDGTEDGDDVCAKVELSEPGCGCDAGAGTAPAVALLASAALAIRRRRR